MLLTSRIPESTNADPADPAFARKALSARANRKSSRNRRLRHAFAAVRRGALALLLAAGLLWPAPARASRSYPVPEDRPIFELIVLDMGESGTFDGYPYVPTRQITSGDRDAIATGFGYWVQVLEPAPSTPLRVLISGSRTANAAGSGKFTSPTGNTSMAEAIIRGTGSGEILAALEWGEMDWGTVNEVQPLTHNGYHANASSVALHEMAHILGILLVTDADRADPGTVTGASCIEEPGTFGTQLYDASGTRYEPGMKLHVAPNALKHPKEGAFNLVGDPNGKGANYTGLYFRGSNVDEVLEGAQLSFPEDYTSAIVQSGTGFRGTVPGIPINAVDGAGEYAFYDFAHIELQNSLMSHQNWRNWGVFMEAELALMQDLGFTLDRKRFFGRSIYVSGREGSLNQVINDTPFFERENGAWLEGVASTTPWGIGLHVYGSWNDVSQVADILTVGDLGTGVRLEGVGNRLTVESGVNVRADGRKGTGLLVSYGRDHEVNVKGTVTALGEGGVAARFDFGDNTLGNAAEYRGSYMWATGSQGNEQPFDSSLLTKIHGPLVDTFNVSGALLGLNAAVFIAENAYVKEINILSGATLAGDIVSDWDPDNPKLSPPDEFKKPDGGTTLRTKLTFGLAPTAEGEAGVQDEGFFLAYDGNILGAKSFDMRLEAGTLALGGSVEVLSLRAADSSTLALLKTGTEPQVRVGETFSLGDRSTLATAFSGNGSVAGISAASADLGSDLTWTLVASPDWYANGTLAVDSPLTAAEGASFSPTAVRLDSSSPTLTFQLAEGGGESGQGGAGATVSVARAKNAYSKFAASSGDAEIGRALSAIAGEARGEMRTLLANMDWSGPDGAGVRAGLSRLSPEAYDAVARATLDEQSAFSRILLDRMLSDFAGRQARTLMADSNGANREANRAAGRTTASSDPGETDGEGWATGSSSDTLRSPDADRWTVWAAPYGSGSFQNAHGSSSAWSSTGVGLVLGADRTFDSGLTLGGHVALAAKRVHIEDRAEGRADTKSAYAGLQAFFAPEEWSGFWLTAQGRLGIESGEMDREVRVGAFSRTAESNWSGFAGSALLGGGKDFATNLGDGALVAGPLAWFEYAFLNRPSFGESGGGAANLDVDAALYESFLMNLGGHAAFRTVLENGTTLGVDLLAAWRHELSYGRFATTAAFSDYGDHSFTSDSDLPGRDSLLARGGFTLANGQGFSARLEAGVELFREDFTAVDVGLRFAWEF